MRKGWKITALGDSLRLIRNGISCKQSKKGPGSKVTRIQTIAALKVDSDKVGYADLSEAEQHSFRLEIGDILFSHINSPSHVGKTALVDEDYGLIHGMNLLCFRAAREIDPRFLDYYLKNLYWSGFWIKRCKQSVNQASVNQQDIKKVPFVYPSLPEQKRIVAILDEAFAGIATAVTNTEKNLANARELFESYLNAAIDAAFSSGEIAVLADLATEITDGDHMPPPKAPSGIPFVTIKNIDKRTRKIDFEDTFSVPRDYFERLKANKRPQEGDVLYTVTGSFGIPVLVENKTEFCFQRHIGLIRPKADTNSRWLYYLLLSPQLFAQAIERATGTAQKTVSLKVLRSFRVPVVQWNQQLDVVKSLDEISAEAERLESIYQQKLTALAELKQSILQKAFSGELTTAPRDEIENALA